MTLKEFAKQLDGTKYEGWEIFSTEEIAAAKALGFVIVYGASDDLMEFDGAIRDEGGCYDGGKVYFDRNGVAYNEDDKKPNVIEALWDMAEEETGIPIAWSYKTDIPHETFMMYEDGEPYCRGIVFDIKDVK